MAINPSCNNIPSQMTKFPVIGDGPFTEDRVKIIEAELLVCLGERVNFQKNKLDKVYYKLKEGTKAYQLSKIGIHIPTESQDYDEVEVYSPVGVIYNWTFSRAWYYWRAYAINKQSNIPFETAKEFNKQFEEVVRVDGFAGGQKVNGDVDSYHIDTVEGFLAFGRLLKGLFEKDAT